MRSLIDVDANIEEILANSSLVYNNVELMRKLIALDLKEKDYDKNLLFISCFYRGLERMLEIKGSSYLDFLE